MIAFALRQVARTSLAGVTPATDRAAGRQRGDAGGLGRQRAVPKFQFLTRLQQQRSDLKHGVRVPTI
jgi:hypothetical protein